MEMIERIVSHRDEPETHRALHHLEHHGTVETITLARADLSRRRLRTTTDRGTDIAIALTRDQHLCDGAVLLLTEQRAILVRMEAEAWLTLRPRDAAVALALGFHVGNLHWRVRFAGTDLQVALEGEPTRYLDRLTDFLDAGSITVVDTDTDTEQQRGAA